VAGLDEVVGKGKMTSAEKTRATTINVNAGIAERYSLLSASRDRSTASPVSAILNALHYSFCDHAKAPSKPFILLRLCAHLAHYPEPRG
jgi:hypothetical protein